MKPPWSTNQLKRLGDALRDEAAIPSALPDYGDVIAWYDHLAADVHDRIAELDTRAMRPVWEGEVTSRAKTIETLREKLRREWPIRLPSIQDLAGVRVVADMSLRRQDEVVRDIIEHFDHDASSVHDMRDDPHSGYRAVHVWLRLEEGRVEVQVRTLLQSAWANAYEALADLAGRQIRYGGDPAWVEGTPVPLRDFVARRSDRSHDLASGLRLLSENQVATIETLRNFVETWWDVGDDSEELAPVLPDTIDLIRQIWQVMIPKRPMPDIGLADSHAFEPALAIMLEIQDAAETMFIQMREQLEVVRAEVQKGSA